MHNLCLTEGSDGWSQPREGAGAASCHVWARRPHSWAPDALETMKKTAKKRDFSYKRGRLYSEYCELTELT